MMMTIVIDTGPNVIYTTLYIIWLRIIFGSTFDSTVADRQQIQAIRH